MNQAVANIIKTHIEGLDFVDKIAGLVSTVYMDVSDKDNNLVQKAFPVACCVTADDCKQGAYNDLMPNSQYKTVIYFEDGGVTFTKGESNWKYYTSTLKLVCWINVAKILGDTCNEGTACTLSAHLITEIIRTLPEFPQHHYPFNHVKSEVTGQQIRDNSIFGKYTFDEKHIQYLMYPYSYFALNITTSFAICIPGDTVYNSECDTPETLNAPVIVASKIFPTGFTITWAAITNANGYEIDIATDAGFISLVENWGDKDLGDVLTIDVTGLTPGITYYLRVRAYNDVDYSENSNTVNITTDYWFLPSKLELRNIFIKLTMVGIGGLETSKFYWSSSESTSNPIIKAWTNYMDGSEDEILKSQITNTRIRACRSFTDVAGAYSITDIGPAGGWIFYIVGTTYYEVAPSDINPNTAWSNIIDSAIGTTDTAIGEGRNNTNEIIAQAGHTTSAAYLCKISTL